MEDHGDIPSASSTCSALTLDRSDESVAGELSMPSTPASMVFDFGIQSYLDAGSTTYQHAAARSLLPDALPDIMDPSTSRSIAIRRVCCIGAGYVGTLPKELHTQSAGTFVGIC